MRCGDAETQWVLFEAYKQCAAMRSTQKRWNCYNIVYCGIVTTTKKQLIDCFIIRVEYVAVKI